MKPRRCPQRSRKPLTIIKPLGRYRPRGARRHPRLCWLRGLDPRGVNQTSACFGFIQHCWSWMFSCQNMGNSLKIMWVVRIHNIQQFSICSFAVSCLPFTLRWLDSHVLITFVLRHVTLDFKTLLKMGLMGDRFLFLDTVSFFLPSLHHPNQATAINLTST